MADTSLKSRLLRLFSTNVVVRNVGGKKLKVADTSRTQSYKNRMAKHIKRKRFNRRRYFTRWRNGVNTIYQ